MKISILQQDLLPAVQTASRSVGVRSTLPVLDNILLETTPDNRLKIAATNLEIGVIRFLPVEIQESGQITVPAKTFLEIISGLGSAQVELEARDDILSITSGKFKATINGISASEFPAIPLPEAEGVSFKKDILLSSSQILFAAAVDEGRPVLTGILTHFSAQKLDFVATDGFRLAHRQITIPDSTNDFKVLIPRRTYEEVLRVIAEQPAEEIQISTSANQNQAVFTVGNTIVSSRLIEGQFPTWEKIIPTQIVTRSLVDKDLFSKAVKLASVFAKSEANIVIIKTSLNKLSLKSQAKELGSQENEIEGQVEGEEIEIAFNAKFLLDAISASPSTQLMVEFSGPLSPTLIKPVGVEGLEYIVMPVRLS